MRIDWNKVDDEPLAQGAKQIDLLLADLCRAYAEFLQRQGRASSTLVRWSKVTNRAHDFVWLGGVLDRERFLQEGVPIKVSPDSLAFGPLKKMAATSVLNPYEREVLYGYPYLVGMIDHKPIRAPLLTMSVAIEAHGSDLVAAPTDEVLRFNSLPFQGIDTREATDLSVQRVMEKTPAFPLEEGALEQFVGVVRREFPSLRLAASLDGALTSEPSEPSGSDFLELIDQAALFICPKTGYFLTSDLEAMSEGDHPPGDLTAIVPLLTGAGEDMPPEFTTSDLDRKDVMFPFPSNRSQRRVALLVDDPTTRIVRVEGPPGTGKSLTIANLACHLAASGKSVLITSQKDKALRVVDEKLRELGLAQLPMTLLRQDKEAKKELLARLQEAGTKRRGREEVRKEADDIRIGLESLSEEYRSVSTGFADAVVWEESVERALRAVRDSGGIRKLLKSLSARRVRSRARRSAPQMTAELSEEARALRDASASLSLKALAVGTELSLADANKAERQHLNVLAHTLKRDQKNHRNFSLFDRLKKQPEQARMVLQLLPVWIMSPDDVARLFPCEPGLFDVVIVDEASQVDLPSVFPVIYRGKKLVVAGDSKQMQPRRFAFTSGQLATQAWSRYSLKDVDLGDILEPNRGSLLDLAYVRADEDSFLDEHYRSLPPIIRFSNHRWYDDRLRVMTDEAHKRFGSPTQPIVELHHVEDGRISNEHQENELEARALVEFLGGLVRDPHYAGATIGVLGLFEEQVALLLDLVLEDIDQSVWEEHQLVVVNPDGFQGDERDVILYSMSWDNDVMPRAALSARQQDSPHIQGMLNVAFTRARDEIHIFHSAPVASFGKEDGHGAIKDWLAHGSEVSKVPRARPRNFHIGEVDSEFEAEVARALVDRGVEVIHQYPSCGFRIDLVCSLDGNRIAVECDGERFHLDEHGDLRLEDVERQAVLERAGWTVLRVPYRAWSRTPDAELARIFSALRRTGEDVASDHEDDSFEDTEGTSTQVHMTSEQQAIVTALREGHIDEASLFKRARELLGYRRLGRLIQQRLSAAGLSLNHLGLLTVEEGEYFLTQRGRSAALVDTGSAGREPTKQARRATRTRGGGTSRKCSCGGTWVLRNGKYGKFYGCSRYPRCHKTRSA